MSAHVVAALHSKLSSERRDGALLLRHLVAESSDGAFRREHGRWLTGLMHALRSDDELAPARTAALLALAVLVERSAPFAQEQRAMASALQRVMPAQVRALVNSGCGRAPVARALIAVLDAAGSNLKPFGARLEAAALPLLAHDDAELRAAGALLLARVPFLCLGSAAGFADAWMQLIYRVLGSLDALVCAVVGGCDGAGPTLPVDRMPALELRMPTAASIDEHLDATATVDATADDAGAGHWSGEDRHDAGALAAAVLAAVEAGDNTPTLPRASASARAECAVGEHARRLATALCACLCEALQPTPSASGRLCGMASPAAAIPPVPVPVRALVRLAGRALHASGLPRQAIPPEGALPDAAAAAALPALQAGMAEVLAALCATVGSAALAHAAEIGAALAAPLSPLALAAAPPARGSELGWVEHAGRLLAASSDVALRLGSGGATVIGAHTLELCVDVLAAALHAQAAAAADAADRGAGAGSGGNAGGKHKRRRSGGASEALALSLIHI
mgnify:CR=1 FL=1